MCLLKTAELLKTVWFLETAAEQELELPGLCGEPKPEAGATPRAM